MNHYISFFIMAAKSAQLKSAFQKAPKQEKIFFLLALATFIAVLLPWMSTPFLGNLGYTISGFNSVGFLTFLGSLGYLLWKVLPVFGVKLPKVGMNDASLQKLLGLLMLAGPVFWLLQSGFTFSVIGYGLWIALVASAGFTYLTFSGKKL